MAGRMSVDGENMREAWAHRGRCDRGEPNHNVVGYRYVEVHVIRYSVIRFHFVILLRLLLSTRKSCFSMQIQRVCHVVPSLVSFVAFYITWGNPLVLFLNCG